MAKSVKQSSRGRTRKIRKTRSSVRKSPRHPKRTRRSTRSKSRSKSRRSRSKSRKSKSKSKSRKSSRKQKKQRKQRHSTIHGGNKWWEKLKKKVTGPSKPIIFSQDSKVGSGSTYRSLSIKQAAKEDLPITPPSRGDLPPPRQFV